MKIIVGLGNPGEKYQTTRHNAGFLAVDFVLRDNKFIQSKPSHEFKSEIFSWKNEGLSVSGAGCGVRRKWRVRVTLQNIYSATVFR